MHVACLSQTGGLKDVAVAATKKYVRGELLVLVLGVLVPALDEDPLWPQLVQIPRSPLHGLEARHLETQKMLRLPDIRRDHRREGEEQRLVGLHGILLQQHVPRSADHDRVDYNCPHLMLSKLLGHHLDDCLCPQHTRLHGVGADVSKDGVELVCHDVRAQHGHALDALRVLRGDRRDGTHSKALQRCKGLQVRLDAGTPPRVRTGDCKQSCWQPAFVRQHLPNAYLDPDVLRGLARHG
mmetsp:Transcript_87941/g.249125  ORF Transcript_87941/g.249125 Transcript_87941/m.249125 type:complete len:239 (-) Transcript_87941:39-755(-)